MLPRNVALALSIGVLLAGCRSHDGSDGRIGLPSIRMSVGEQNVLAGYLRLPQFAIAAVSIGGSEKRLAALQNGSLDVAGTVADVTYLAFNGYLSADSAPLSNVRGIALIGRAAVHLLVGPKTDASRGFGGMRIVLGNPAGGNTSLGERLINSTGVATSAIRGEFLAYDVAVDKLLKGTVDAVIVTGRTPQEPVAAALKGGARLMDISGPEVDRLRVYYPLLRKTLIPSGTYHGQHDSVHTVGVDLLLVCRADLDNALVYELTRAYFEQFPESMRHQIDPQRAPATVIPLHAGAARYYREREMRR